MNCLQRPMPSRVCTRTTRVAVFRTHHQSSKLSPKNVSAELSHRRVDGRSPVACQGVFGLGFAEIAVVVGIAALVFGPSKLPELGKGLGQTVKSFQTAAREFEAELKEGMQDENKTDDSATRGNKHESK